MSEVESAIFYQYSDAQEKFAKLGLTKWRRNKPKPLETTILAYDNRRRFFDVHGQYQKRPRTQILLLNGIFAIAFPVYFSFAASEVDSYSPSGKIGTYEITGELSYH